MDLAEISYDYRYRNTNGTVSGQYLAGPLSRSGLDYIELTRTIQNDPGHSIQNVEMNIDMWYSDQGYPTVYYYRYF